MKKMSELAHVDDQYMSMLLVNACTDKELLKKLLELGKDDFNVNKITTLARRYESEITVMEALKKKNKGGETIKQVTSKETRCWTCDSLGHMMVRMVREEAERVKAVRTAKDQ